MKIISLQAENIKKLVAVEITPTGNMVQITGKNGAGKTSVLDSIWWALAGASHIQAAPIRTGASKAIIKLDLGEIKVTRTFSRKNEGGATTSISVENAEGAKFPSPQRMLDALLGELCFDPLAFARMAPKEQFDALKRFVPGVDFAAIENANRGDFDKRTELNRTAKDLHAAASLITVPTNTPEEPINESSLIAELEGAGAHNSDIEMRKGNRERILGQAAVLLTETEGLRVRAGDLRRQAAQLDEQAASKESEAKALSEKISGAPPLAEPIDVSAVRQRIESARATNLNVNKMKERHAKMKRAEEIANEADALTARMEQRAANKQAAIEAAKMPATGIGFGDGIVLLNGLPFDQASDAEQLRTSVAIAIAANPKLRVIRIRDGSLLDDDAMQLLGEIADANDMQIWIERVDSSGTVGFVLEDGHLRTMAPT